jgi:hypothetical protein
MRLVLNHAWALHLVQGGCWSDSVFVLLLLLLLLLLLPPLLLAVVSDAGSGGQVLLDSTSFTLLKDRLEELGQVRYRRSAAAAAVSLWTAL